MLHIKIKRCLLKFTNLVIVKAKFNIAVCAGSFPDLENIFWLRYVRVVFPTLKIKMSMEKHF